MYMFSDFVVNFEINNNNNIHFIKYLFLIGRLMSKQIVVKA